MPIAADEDSRRPWTRAKKWARPDERVPHFLVVACVAEIAQPAADPFHLGSASCCTAELPGAEFWPAAMQRPVIRSPRRWNLQRQRLCEAERLRGLEIDDQR